MKKARDFIIPGFMCRETGQYITNAVSVEDAIKAMEEYANYKSRKNNDDIICQRCGSINDYKTEVAGPHLKAICNGCNIYIKFISKQ